MDAGAKRAAIKKYFASFPKWAVWAIIIGLPLTAAWGIGLLLIIPGILVLVSFYKKPTDAEMDKFIAEDLSLAIKKSLKKASIDESELVGESVVVTGPRIWDTGGADCLSREGKDGNLRFTPINISVLNMTANQIIGYQSCLDLTTGNFLNESTDEYFYTDVVSVSTKTDSRSINLKKHGKVETIQLDQAQLFVLTTTGGTSFETILQDPKLIEMMGGGNIPTTHAEKAIQVVRTMVRDKKQASMALRTAV